MGVLKKRKKKDTPYGCPPMHTQPLYQLGYISPAMYVYTCTYRMALEPVGWESGLQQPVYAARRSPRELWNCPDPVCLPAMRNASSGLPTWLGGLIGCREEVVVEVVVVGFAQDPPVCTIRRQKDPRHGINPLPDCSSLFCVPARGVSE